MRKKAIVFSGQGAQFAGMGKNIYEKSTAGRSIFERAKKLNPNILDICFDGQGLDSTVNAQPAIFVCGLAGAMALDEKGIKADMCAGFSAGEIAALVLSNIVDFESGYKIIERRAKLMQECSDKVDGKMAAVLGVDEKQLELLLKDFKGVYAVNFNSPTQIVISGLASEVDKFLAHLKNIGKRAVMLAVSGAFHTPYMQPAADGLQKFLRAVKFNAPTIPIYSNYSAKPYGDAFNILPLQMTNPVKWVNQVTNMIDDGATTFIEVGAGNVLTGLIKKISKDVLVISAADKMIDLAALEGCFER